MDPYRSSDPNVVRGATARTKLRLAQQNREHRREQWLDLWRGSDVFKLLITAPWIAGIAVAAYAAIHYINFIWVTK